MHLILLMTSCQQQLVLYSASLGLDILSPPPTPLNLPYFRFQPLACFVLSASLSFMAAEVAAWSLIRTHCLLCDELQHEILLQVAMERLCSVPNAGLCAYTMLAF